MASQPKENWWRNIPNLTKVMDLVLPSIAPLAQSTQTRVQFKQELESFCDFLAQHPLAIKHNKNKRAILEHMKLNIDLYNQGKPLHH